jgi:hypothetical protein
MNFDEVVGEIIERRRSRMFLWFARETIREASVAAHRSANRPISDAPQTKSKRVSGLGFR